MHVRRYCDSEALVEFPETVRPIFVETLGPEDRPLLDVSWDVVCQMTIGRMDLNRGA